MKGSEQQLTWDRKMFPGILRLPVSSGLKRWISQAKRRCKRLPDSSTARRRGAKILATQKEEVLLLLLRAARSSCGGA